jgi:hypothetical protein
MTRREQQRGLLLERTADGWALISGDGSVAFEATGPDARMRCLREACRRDVARLKEGATSRFSGPMTGLPIG